MVVGTLGELYGWHYGFGAAGVGMVMRFDRLSVGPPLASPDVRPARDAAATRPLLTRDERSALVLADAAATGAVAAGASEIRRSSTRTCSGRRLISTWCSSPAR